MKKIIAIGLCLALHGQAFGVVAFKNTNTMGHGAASPFTSASYVCTSPANLAVACVAFDAAAGMSVTSVTFGGVTMTAAGTTANNATGNEYAAIYTLLNPPASGTLVATISGTITDIYTNVHCFTGANTTTPVRAATYTTKTCTASPCSTVVTSNVNDLTVSCGNGGAGSFSGTNQTSDGASTLGTDNGAHDHATTAATSVTHTWTGGANQAFAALSIDGDAAAGGTAVMPSSGFLGVGGRL